MKKANREKAERRNRELKKFRHHALLRMARKDIKSERRSMVHEPAEPAD